MSPPCVILVQYFSTEAVDNFVDEAQNNWFEAANTGPFC
jgi:hypothetical protein